MIEWFAWLQIVLAGLVGITSFVFASLKRPPNDYTLGGLLPPLQITRKDHEGGGWVRIFQATKDGYKPNTDWYRAYRAEVRELLEAEIAHTK